MENQSVKNQYGNPILKLLIFDDDEEILHLLSAGLRFSKHEVVAVSNVKDALKALVSSHFDAVLSDVVMPNGNGLWLVNALRSIGSKIPVILFSASIDLNASVARANGANHFLRQPLDLDVVEAAIAEVVA